MAKNDLLTNRDLGTETFMGSRVGPEDLRDISHTGENPPNLVSWAILVLDLIHACLNISNAFI